MSVDLALDSPRPIAITPLLPKIAAVFADLLGLTTPPALSVQRLAMIGLRSSLLYVLGAAAAIALAREFGSGIWDDRKFFSHEEHTSPEALLRRLRVAGRYHYLREAADHVHWGPAGGP